MRQPVRWSQGMYGCPIGMREDRVLDCDIEAIARRLCERDHGHPLSDEPVCEGYRDEAETLLSLDRKSTRLNSSHIQKSRMPSSA